MTRWLLRGGLHRVQHLRVRALEMFLFLVVAGTEGSSGELGGKVHLCARGRAEPLMSRPMVHTLEL